MKWGSFFGKTLPPEPATRVIAPPVKKPSVKGRVVKVNKGVLKDKYAMIVKGWDKGYSVVPEAIDWPKEVPTEYNAIYVQKESVTEITQEEVTLLVVKFPDASQYE